MNEYNFCEEIKNEYKVEELESKTLSYRFNGFIYACDIDLRESDWIKEISPMRIPYINKKYEDSNKKYNVNFSRNYNHEKGNSMFVIGEYNNLKFLFMNYYDEDKKIDKINEIPFHITLGKSYNEFAYQLDMETISKTNVKFFIKKLKEKSLVVIPNTLTFTADVTDFGKILKLVKSFVHNPELVFIAYNEIMNRKEVSFSNKELSVALVEDEKLDKPKKKKRKILKKQ